MRATTNRFTMTLVVGLVVGLGIHAEAQQLVPYKAAGENAVFDSSTGYYEGVGVGTHLGKHTISGFVVPSGGPDIDNGIFFEGTFWGLQTVTAANGDTLDMYLEGEVLLVFNEDGMVEGEWYPDFTILGGTGRFKNATGSVSGVAINPPFAPTEVLWPFNWYIDGKFDLGKKKK